MRRDVTGPLLAMAASLWLTSKGTIFSILAVSIVSALAAIGAPYLFSRLIDQMQANGQNAMVMVLAYAAAMGVALASQQIAQFISYMFSERVSYVASVAFFSRLLDKSLGFFADHNAAEIQSAQQRGISALAGMAQLLLITIVPGSLQILLAISLMGATMTPEVAVIVAIYGGFFIGLTFLANRWTAPFLERAIEASQENAQFVGNAVTSIDALRYFRSGPWMRKTFEKTAQMSFDNWRSFSLRRAGYALIYGAALAIQLAVNLIVLLPRYEAGQMSIGEVVLFNALLLQLNLPFETIGYAIDDMVKSYMRFIPFSEMWNAPAVPHPKRPLDYQIDKGTLTFREVTYRYANGRGVDRVSFSAERGKITFIRGETGAGKSTLMRLLLKTLEPQAGNILVDGTDLALLGQDEWLSKIGVVPQEILLLNVSVRSNIVLGRTHDEARLERALRRAAIYDRVMDMPHGLDAVVGERGVKLSGGERQRLAIARALYEDPEFLLLDEASSALDDQTEASIMSRVREMANEVTVLAITHRTNTILPSDHVVDLSLNGNMCRKALQPEGSEKRSNQRV